MRTWIGYRRLGLVMFSGLVLAGTAWLIFDLVVGRAAGLVVAGLILLVVLLLWVVYPLALRRRAVAGRSAS